jgi:hypothetical protein
MLWTPPYANRVMTVLGPERSPNSSSFMKLSLDMCWLGGTLCHLCHMCHRYQISIPTVNVFLTHRR